MLLQSPATRQMDRQMRIQTKRQTHGNRLPEQTRHRKAKPNTVNPKLLAREQKAHENMSANGPSNVRSDIVKQLSFKTEKSNGAGNQSLLITSKTLYMSTKTPKTPKKSENQSKDQLIEMRRLTVSAIYLNSEGYNKTTTHPE